MQGHKNMYFAIPPPDLSYKTIWLKNQMMKTLYQSAYYKELLRVLSHDIEKFESNPQLEANFTEELFEYIKFKYIYMRAKVLRKTREFSKAEEDCNKLIEQVKSKIANSENEDACVQISWKFAVKAAYLKSTMLAGQMEFAKPKQLMTEFAKPVLLRILKKFKPSQEEKAQPEATAEETKDDDVKADPVNEKEEEMPAGYYTFQYRRFYAKLRRIGYFVGESERLYRQLLHEELKFYDLADQPTV